MFQGNYGYAAGDREAFTIEDSSESARKTQPLPHEHTTKTRQPTVILQVQQMMVIRPTYDPQHVSEKIASMEFHMCLSGILYVPLQVHSAGAAKDEDTTQVRVKAGDKEENRYGILYVPLEAIVIS